MLAAACALAIVSPAFAIAQPTPTALGAEFPIVGSITGDQMFPQLAANATGGYLVWQDNSVTDLGLRIRAARMNTALSPVDGPIIVSSAAKSKTAGNQEKPQVALLSDGGAAIVWQGGKPGKQQIFARFVSAEGLLVKKDIRISRNTKNNQSDPAVTVLNDGSILIVWSSSRQDGDMDGIFGQRLSATGSKVGNEFQINQFTANNQRSPAVAALANGGFVVCWVSELQRGPSSIDIYARSFDANGVGTDEFPVDQTVVNACANPTVVGTPDGGFAVAWSQNSDVGLTVGSGTGDALGGVQTSRSPDGWDIWARLYAGDLSAPDAFRVNNYTTGDQFRPQLAASGNQCIVVWTSLGQDGYLEGVFGRSISLATGVAGSEFQLNDRVISRQLQPVVASAGGRRVLAVWTSFYAQTSFDLSAKVYQTSDQ